MKTALIKVLMSLSVVFGAGVGVAATASAQSTGTASCTSGYTCPTLQTVPASTSPGSSIPAAVSTDPLPSTALATTSSTALAFTGMDIGGTLGVAAVLVGGGIVLVRTGRRKRSA